MLHLNDRKFNHDDFCLFPRISQQHDHKLTALEEIEPSSCGNSKLLVLMINLSLPLAGHSLSNSTICTHFN